MLSFTAFVSTALVLSQLASATIKANAPIQLRINAGDGYKACLTAVSPTNGAQVTVSACTDNPSQTFHFPSGAPASGNSAAQPIKVYDNYCLDVTDGKDQNGNKLQIWSCVNGSKNQQWVVKSLSDGVAELQWAGKSRCVDNTDGLRNGTQAQIWSCGNTYSNQHFNPVDTSSGAPPGAEVQFARSREHRNCIGVSAKYNGSPVTNVPCSPRNEFNTFIQSTANGPLTMGDFCVDATDGKNANGTPLQLWTCVKNSSNQKWTVGGDKIEWVGKGKCVDMTNGNETVGNQLQLWNCINGNTNQVWYELPPL